MQCDAIKFNAEKRMMRLFSRCHLLRKWYVVLQE